MNKDLLIDLVNGKNIMIEHAINQLRIGNNEIAIRHLWLAVDGNDNIVKYIKEEIKK